MSVITKKTLSTLLGIGVLVSIIYFSPGKTLAYDKSEDLNNLVTRIAQKFNLQESEVQAVFMAVRDERLAAQRDIRNQKLSEAVKDGLMTEEQKNNLIVYLDQNFPGKGKARADLKKWLKKQGINPVKLRNYLKHHYY